MALFTNSWEEVKAWWQNATPMTRAAATGMALLLIVGLIIAASLAASPDYQPIFHGVSGKDASAIETVLREHNITMHYSDKEGTISVPSKDGSNATMYVEAAGILSKEAGIDGIEALDKIGMGTSTGVEQERIRAADEGELARKLMRLEPVDTAAVTISPSSNSSLFGNDVPASASVILGLKQGETVSPEQVKGMVYLIAHAVPGLSPKNVTLTDQTGVSLWKDNGMGDNQLGDGQPLDESAKFAEAERVKIQKMLDETLGLHKALVTVNAELDFDQTQVHSVEHDPVPGTHQGLPVTTHDKTESYSGGAASGMGGAGGVAGAGSNINAPTYSSGGSGGNGSYKSDDTTSTYENNVKDTVVQKAPGGVKSLSVAALVDQSIPPANAAAIKNIIGAAIGVTPGDTTRFVTVQQIPFDTSTLKAQNDQMKSLAQGEMWTNVARALAVCVVAAMLLFFLMRSSRRAGPQLALAGNGGNIGLLSGNDPDLEAMLEERPLRVEDVLAEMPDVEPRRTPRRRAHAPSIEEQQDLKLESIQDMISSSPEAVALLVKGWMAEDAPTA